MLIDLYFLGAATVSALKGRPTVAAMFHGSLFTRPFSLMIAQKKIAILRLRSVAYRLHHCTALAQEFHQLVMQTNRKFDDLIDIEFAGKKVIVIASRYSGSFNIIGGEFIDIQELMVSGDNASLGFIYNSIEVRIDLTKTDDGWVTKNAIKDHKQEDYAERETLVQLALDDDFLRKVTLKEENGQFKPLSILSNGHFSNMLEVTFDGKKLEIVPFKYNRAYDRNTTYIEVTKFQVKRKRASLEFSFNKNNFKVNYRMKNGEWSIQSFTKSSG